MRGDMSSPNNPQGVSSFNQPYTQQTNIGTSSIAALFTTMSDNDSTPGGGAPTFGPDNTIIENSLMSKLSSIKTTFATSSVSNTNSKSTGVGATAVTGAPTATSSANSSTTVQTSGPSQTRTSALSDQTSGGGEASGSSTGTSTTVSTTSAVANDGTTVAKSSTAGGMSAGTKAAIAVPIVVLALAALVIAILLIRRRKRKRQEKGEPAEKVPLAARKKRWTRHLRIFSFDTELLMGGRFSSTNSVRSRETHSMRSGASSQNSQAPSVHTVDEVAPPYRDAISTAQPPSIGQIMAGAAAVGVGRSASNATAGTAGTAPPPYIAGANRALTPGTPSTIGRRDPFSDSAPVSPIEASPFNDPPNHSPAISRNSSVYHTDGASEAASIREATLARNASVMSGGRIINSGNKI